MNITIVSYYDNCQHGYHIAEALRRQGKHNVYELTGERTAAEYKNALGVADVIIVTNDYLPQIYDSKFYIVLEHLTLPGNGIQTKENAILISSPCAGYYRRPIPGYEEHALGLYPLHFYSDNCDLVAPDKPEMIYPGMDNVVLPIAWASEDHENMWRRNGHIVIGAYQGMGKDRKGVKQYLMPAIDKARQKGIEIELLLSDLCYDFTQEEYINRVARCDLCFEEITPIGVYGNCGVQQMSLGIPTIVNIDVKLNATQILPFANDYGKPCIKCHGVDDLVGLFESISQDKVDLAAISRESREYALQYHGYGATARTVDTLITLAQAKRERGIGRKRDNEPILNLYNEAVKAFQKKDK